MHVLPRQVTGSVAAVSVRADGTRLLPSRTGSHLSGVSSSIAVAEGVSTQGIKY